MRLKPVDGLSLETHEVPRLPLGDATAFTRDYCGLRLGFYGVRKNSCATSAVQQILLAGRGVGSALARTATKTNTRITLEQSALRQIAATVKRNLIIIRVLETKELGAKSPNSGIARSVTSPSNMSLLSSHR